VESFSLISKEERKEGKTKRKQIEKKREEDWIYKIYNVYNLNFGDRHKVWTVSYFLLKFKE